MISEMASCTASGIGSRDSQQRLVSETQEDREAIYIVMLRV